MRGLFMTLGLGFFLFFSVVYAVMSASIDPVKNPSEDVSRDARSLEIESFTTEPKPEGLIQVTSDKIYHNLEVSFKFKDA